MKKLHVLPVLFAFILIAKATPSAGQDLPIMQPDNETRLEWMREDLSLPKAYIDPAVKPKRGSFSLLSSLPYVPSERQQGNCGDCWTWAGTGCAEVDHAVQGVSDRLSIQYINSCGTGPSGSWCCCGGNLSWFSQWYSGQGMFIPWSNTNAAFSDASLGSYSCPVSPSSAVSCGSISTSPCYPISSISPQTISTYGETQYTAIQNIKNVLHQNKAVYFGFFLPNQTSWDWFRDYWNNKDESWWIDLSVWSGYAYESTGGGHAVLIVGYNDDATTPYWEVVNSWGTASGNRPNGVFKLKMDIDYSSYLNYPDPGNAMLLFQTLDVGFGSAPPTAIPAPTPTPTPACPISVNPNRTSFSSAYDEMYIYVNADAISTPCYPFVRIVTPYYGTFYLTSRLIIYPCPVPYLSYPVVIEWPMNGLYLTGIWWKDCLPGTYYLEGGAVNAWTLDYIGPVHTTAFTLN